MKGKKKAGSAIVNRTEVLETEQPINPLEGRPAVVSGGAYAERFQQHPMATEIVLGLGKFGAWFAHELGRFRDVAVVRRDLGAFDVQLLLRVGGPHRERFRSTWEAIRAHPEYVRDEDLAADRTYALVTFTAGPGWEVPLLIEAAERSMPAWEDRVASLQDDAARRALGGA